MNLNYMIIFTSEQFQTTRHAKENLTVQLNSENWRTEL